MHTSLPSSPNGSVNWCQNNNKIISKNINRICSWLCYETIMSCIKSTIGSRLSVDIWLDKNTTVEIPFSRNGSVDITRIFYDNVMKLLLYMLDVRFPCYMGIVVIGSLNACVWTVVSHGWCYKVNICQQVLFYIPTNTTNHLNNFTNDCIITIKERRREKKIFILHQ